MLENNSDIVNIITSNQSFCLNIIYDRNSNLKKFIFDFFSVFSNYEDNRFYFKNPQLFLVETQIKLLDLINNYSETYPTINRLRDFLKNNKIGEYFYFLINIKNIEENIAKIQIYLDLLNKYDDEIFINLEFNKKMQNLEMHFGKIFLNYEAFFVDSSKDLKVGTQERRHRKCRFCALTLSDGITFNTKAHAISEAIGNKKVFLFDECDNCNFFFGHEIEPALIDYLDILRVIWGIQGKSGIPRIKFNDGEIKLNDNTVEILVEKINRISNKKIEITLNSNKKYSNINIYKSLCKFALSVIDERHLLDFTDTIDWLMNLNNTRRVPLVLSGIFPHFFKNPQINIYFRKNNNKKRNKKRFNVHAQPIRNKLSNSISRFRRTF